MIFRLKALRRPAKSDFQALFGLNRLSGLRLYVALIGHANRGTPEKFPVTNDISLV